MMIPEPEQNQTSIIYFLGFWCRLSFFFKWEMRIKIMNWYIVMFVKNSHPSLRLTSNDVWGASEKVCRNHLHAYSFVRYEESQLHRSIYQMHVKLLGPEKTTVISEHTAEPTEDLETHSHSWKEVSYWLTLTGTSVCLKQIFLWRFLCWPAGLPCVLQLWTRSEIRPFQAPTEEQLPEWFLWDAVCRQLCCCETSQKQFLDTFMSTGKQWFVNNRLIYLFSFGLIVGIDLTFFLIYFFNWRLE